MKSSNSVEEAFSKIIEAFATTPGVTVGAKGKKGFGSSALRVKDKIFAMVSSKGSFVVKLPQERVDELLASGSGKRFDPGHGRLMREWIELDPGSQNSWIALAKEAKSFVAKRS